LYADHPIHATPTINNPKIHHPNHPKYRRTQACGPDVPATSKFVRQRKKHQGSQPQPTGLRDDAPVKPPTARWSTRAGRDVGPNASACPAPCAPDGCSTGHDRLGALFDQFADVEVSHSVQTNASKVLALGLDSIIERGMLRNGSPNIGTASGDAARPLDFSSSAEVVNQQTVGELFDPSLP
jgi:hypothetical protein